MRSLLIYTTVGCHLCEQAEQLLAPVLHYIDSQTGDPENKLVLQKVEIVEDARLIADYGVRIPVIRIDGTDPELGWPFDQAQAYEFLNAQLMEVEGS